jgi:putative transposase
MASWPHAPVHLLGARGAYIVTGATHLKQHLFRAPDMLSLVQEQLFALELEWRLQAWAVFSNHYHFVVLSPEDPGSLRTLIGRLHSLTAREANRRDGIEGRKVWFQFWDTHLGYERSYLARLNYVHQNPVRHGLVPGATAYPWCSAGWSEQQAQPAFVRSVCGFKTDRISVPDDFEVEWPPGEG